MKLKYTSVNNIVLTRAYDYPLCKITNFGTRLSISNFIKSLTCRFVALLVYLPIVEEISDKVEENEV